VVTSEWAIVKAVTATSAAVGAFFSLSRQSEPMNVRNGALFLLVGGIVGFNGSIVILHYISLPKDDLDLKLGVAGLSGFFLGIVSMSLSMFIYNLGVMLKEDPMKFIKLISEFFGRLSTFLKGDKDA